MFVLCYSIHLYPLKRLRNADKFAELDNIQPMCITLAEIFSLIMSSLLCLLKEILVQYCDYYYYRSVYPELPSFQSSILLLSLSGKFFAVI